MSTVAALRDNLMLSLARARFFGQTFTWRPGKLRRTHPESAAKRYLAG